MLRANDDRYVCDPLTFTCLLPPTRSPLACRDALVTLNLCVLGGPALAVVAAYPFWRWVGIEVLHLSLFVGLIP